MTNSFFISDTHFGHANICKFTHEDGSKLRPWDDVNEMNEALIDYWNAIVGPKDKVYHLGDFSMSKNWLYIADRLNGHKRLILGNHDTAPMSEYAKYFVKIGAYGQFDNMVLSHIPVHTNQVSGRYKANIHGHLHGGSINDPRYFCASVENINYEPMAYDVIKKYLDL